jgi:uncharacterized membrane protein
MTIRAAIHTSVLRTKSQFRFFLSSNQTGWMTRFGRCAVFPVLIEMRGCLLCGAHDKFSI